MKNCLPKKKHVLEEGDGDDSSKYHHDIPHAPTMILIYNGNIYLQKIFNSYINPKTYIYKNIYNNLNNDRCHCYSNYSYSPDGTRTRDLGVISTAL